MKNKRLLSLLLCICLAVSCLAGITVSASADDTITYTVKKGDYLYQVCKRNGLDYYTCKNAIMILNGWSTETQCNRIVPGQEIYLPASDAIAKTVKASATTTTSSTSTVSINGKSYSTTTTSTSNVATKNGDTVAYYLVPYTVKSGDYLAKICSDLNTSYTAYKNIINSVNGLTGTRIYAGKTLYIPTATPPAGSSCFAVIAHRVDTGETMTTICNGLNGQPASSVITQGVNYGININYITAGQVVYVPVAATSPVNPSPSPVPGPVSGKFEIGFTTSQHGDAFAMIGTAIATGADAGKTITIVPNADDGYAQKSVSVTRTDTKTTVPIKDNQFTMPTSNVKVSVTYAQSKSISKAKTTNGSFSIKVDGISGQTAAYGSSVQIIPEPKTGYVVDTVTFGNDSKGTTVVKANSNGEFFFNMPNYNVKVSVTFKASAYFNITPVKPENAKITYKMDGIALSSTNPKAAGGAKIEAVITPDDGYSIKNVKVFNGSTEVAVTDNGKGSYSFKMPEGNAELKIELKYEKTFTVSEVKKTGGSLSFFAVRDGENVFTSKFHDGETVYIKPNPDSKKEFSNIASVKFATGAYVTPVKKTVGGVEFYSFKMPTNNVSVTAAWKDSAKELFRIYDSDLKNASYRCYDATGFQISSAAKDDTVTLKVYPNTGYALNDDPSILSKDDKSPIQVISCKKDGTFAHVAATKTAEYTYEFKMPGNSIAIRLLATQGGTKSLIVSKKDFKIIDADDSSDVSSVISGAGIIPATLKIMSDSVDVSDSSLGVNVAEGTKLEIKINNLKEGYKISKVWAWGATVGEQVIKPDGNGRYFYTVTRKDCTDSEIYFRVQLTADKFEILYSYPAHGSYTINGFSNTVKAYAGETITISGIKSSDETKYEFGKVVIDDVDQTVNMEGGAYSFTMPARNVKTQVTFKEIAP